MLARTGLPTGSRSNRSDRPVRAEFQNYALLHCSSFSLSSLFFLSLSSAKKSLYIDILFKTKQYLPTNIIRLSIHRVFLFLLFFPSLIFTPNSIFLAPRNLDTTKSKNSSYPDFLFQKYLLGFFSFFIF